MLLGDSLLPHPLGDSDTTRQIKSSIMGSGAGPNTSCPLQKHCLLDAVAQLLISRGLVCPPQESLGCAMVPRRGQELEQV